jgi:hypothetical protein
VLDSPAEIEGVIEAGIESEGEVEVEKLAAGLERAWGA